MPGPRTTDTYEETSVKVAYSALLEVAASLQAYSDSIVLIGGWVPFLLLRQHQPEGNPFRHIGSIDSDWVIDPGKVSSREYETIVRALKKRGFVEDPEIRFRLVKKTPVPGMDEPLDVAVDFLTEAPPKGSGAGKRHRKLHVDLEARTLEAAGLALSHSSRVALEGVLLGGGRLKLDIRMADVVGSIGTKGFALGRRYEEKDNYDLYAVIANYGQGPTEVAGIVRPFLGEALLDASLRKVREWFETVSGAGPVAVGNFYVNETGSARERRIRDAFEVLNRFLLELGKT
ncbi:MAG: hypothetical protein WC935_06030 [Thermoleophilia bacterium]